MHLFIKNKLNAFVLFSSEYCESLIKWTTLENDITVLFAFRVYF